MHRLGVIPAQHVSEKPPDNPNAQQFGSPHPSHSSQLRPQTLWTPDKPFPLPTCPISRPSELWDMIKWWFLSQFVLVPQQQITGVECFTFLLEFVPCCVRVVLRRAICPLRSLRLRITPYILELIYMKAEKPLYLQRPLGPVPHLPQMSFS